MQTFNCRVERSVAAVAERSVGVGIVGYGVAGQLFHGRVVKGVPGLEVKVVSTTSRTRAAAARADHGADIEVCTPDEVVGHPDVEVVVVATPNVSHAEWVRKAIRADKHVVVDKPVATTHEEALSLEAASSRSTARVIPFHNRRWDGDFMTLTELAHTGNLGRVRHLESRFEYVEGVADAGWRGDPAGFGGPLYDLGPHLIDQACLLLGVVHVVRCELHTLRSESGMPDTVMLSMDHEDGGTSRIHLSVACPTELRFRARGDRGVYVKHGLDPQEPQLEQGMHPGCGGWAREEPHRWGYVERRDGSRESVPTERGRYEDYYAAVRDAVISGTEPPVDYADGLRVSQIIDAAVASAESGTEQALRQ